MVAITDSKLARLNYYVDKWSYCLDRPFGYCKTSPYNEKVMSLNNAVQRGERNISLTTTHHSLTERRKIIL